MGKPTLQDIADECGMHRNTVSEILRGKYEGDADTISKVKTIAAELGYKGLTATEALIAPVQDGDLPEGVTVERAEIKMTASHEFTIHFSVKVACEWEYDKDENGNKIDESEKVVGWEDLQFQQCLSERPTLKEVERIIAAKKLELPEAV